MSSTINQRKPAITQNIVDATPNNEQVKPTHSDPEVKIYKTKRRFTAGYKLRILEELDRCFEPGQIGSILRREGLYSSMINKWRHKKKAGELSGLQPIKRGVKPSESTLLAEQIKNLEKCNTALQQRLQQAETIIDVQKKISTLFGIKVSTVNPVEIL